MWSLEQQNIVNFGEAIRERKASTSRPRLLLPCSGLLCALPIQPGAPPSRQHVDNWSQALAFRGDAVLPARRNLGVHCSHHESDFLKLAQLLGEQPLRDPRQAAV